MKIRTRGLDARFEQVIHDERVDRFLALYHRRVREAQEDYVREREQAMARRRRFRVNEGLTIEQDNSVRDTIVDRHWPRIERLELRLEQHVKTAKRWLAEAAPLIQLVPQEHFELVLDSTLSNFSSQPDAAGYAEAYLYPFRDAILRAGFKSEIIFRPSVTPTYLWRLEQLPARPDRLEVLRKTNMRIAQYELWANLQQHHADAIFHQITWEDMKASWPRTVNIAVFNPYVPHDELSEHMRA